MKQDTVEESGFFFETVRLHALNDVRIEEVRRCQKKNKLNFVTIFFFFCQSLDDICVMLLLLMMYPQKFRSDNVERNCNFEDIPTEILKEELNAVFCNTITRRSRV